MKDLLKSSITNQYCNLKSKDKSPEQFKVYILISSPHELQYKKTCKDSYDSGYQFGRNIGKELFPDGVTFQLFELKRVRQVFYSGNRIATARARDGFFTLVLKELQLSIGLCQGKNSGRYFGRSCSFSGKRENRFDKTCDWNWSGLRAGEELLLTDQADRLLATGHYSFPQRYWALDNGAAVNVRVGVASEKSHQASENKERFD